MLTVEQRPILATEAVDRLLDHRTASADAIACLIASAPTCICEGGWLA